LRAKKRFGQNFLINPFLLDFITQTAASFEGDVLIEIGGGTGNLTKRLAALPFSDFVVVEIDRELIPLLKDSAPKACIIQGNILDIPLNFGHKQVIAGNLPYYITKPILNHILHYRENVTGGVFMVQKEVAEAITAPVGAENYNAYSVFLRLFARIKVLKHVKKGEFRPVPGVDSSLIRIDIHDQKEMFDKERITDIIFRAFRERRKTLVNNLKKEFDRERVEGFLRSLGKSEDARAQELTPEEFRLLLYELKEGETT
jgi:16S rRNA (adenine1518-N6/adenine1519-N6)-dimethyltransferase